jgi:bifunctional UDP-N-acetylglucosamine pyrophosphorylase/glucosamine-1-phosphate N-acetyltransferase
MLYHYLLTGTLCIAVLTSTTATAHATQRAQQPETTLHERVEAVVLAAGRGTRFKSNRSKMLEVICGQEMVLFPVKLLEQLAVETTVVVGFQKELVIACIKNINPRYVNFVEQPSFVAGTGDAVRCTADRWHKDHILILNGDMPLVTPQIINNLYAAHSESDAAISFVIAFNNEPGTGYGRIVEHDGHIKIVEAKDFTGSINEHCFINAGIYLVKRSFLQEYINKLDTNNANHEFYITDLVELADAANFTVRTVVAPFDYVRGVNDQQERGTAEQIVRENILKHWMKEGIHFADARNVAIDLDVTIGAGSTIGYGAQLLRGTAIGNNCIIDGYVCLEHCTIGDNSHVHAMSILKDVNLDAHTQVGPFAHIDGNL